MILYTMGFTQKSAEHFFELIKSNNIKILVDIRLNNKSQLAGFTKGEDLQYFLQEICNCKYQHCIEYAPTKSILDAYKKKIIDWKGYVEQYIPLIKSRQVISCFFDRFEKYDSVCLLCSEPIPDQCHRRLFAELLCDERPDVIVNHI